MGQFAFRYVAKGIPREKLFPWYFDYSPDDVEIIRKRGDGSLLSRQVTKDGTNRVTVENVHLVGGRPTRVIYETTMHPEEYSCDIRITSRRGESHRHYTFADIPEGTKIEFHDNYTIRSVHLRIADAFGLVKRRLARTSEMAMKAYVAEAEELLKNT